MATTPKTSKTGSTQASPKAIITTSKQGFGLLSSGYERYEEIETHVKQVSEVHEAHASAFQDAISQSIAEHSQALYQAFLSRMSTQTTTHTLKTSQSLLQRHAEFAQFKQTIEAALEYLGKSHTESLATYKKEVEDLTVGYQKTIASWRLELGEIERLKGCTVTGSDWKGELVSNLQPFFGRWNRVLDELKLHFEQKMDELVQAVQQDDVILRRTSEMEELSADNSKLSMEITNLEHEKNALSKQLEAKSLELDAKTKEVASSHARNEELRISVSDLQAQVEAEQKISSERQQEHAQTERVLTAKVHELEQREASLSASVQTKDVSLRLQRQELETYQGKIKEVTLRVEELTVQLQIASEHSKALQAKFEQELAKMKRESKRTVEQIQISHRQEREESLSRAQKLQEEFKASIEELVVNVQHAYDGLPVPKCTTITLTESKDELSRLESENMKLEAELKKEREEGQVSARSFSAIKSEFAVCYQELEEYCQKLDDQRVEMTTLRTENSKLTDRNQSLEAFYKGYHNKMVSLHADEQVPAYLYCERHKDLQEFHYSSMHKTMRRHSNCLCHSLGAQANMELDQLAPQPERSADEGQMSLAPSAPAPVTEKVIEKLKRVGKCTQGYQWNVRDSSLTCDACKVVKPNGYQCGGGGHYVCADCVNAA